MFRFKWFLKYSGHERMSINAISISIQLFHIIHQYTVDCGLSVMFFSVILLFEVQPSKTYGEITSNYKVTEKSMTLHPQPSINDKCFCMKSMEYYFVIFR